MWTPLWIQICQFFFNYNWQLVGLVQCLRGKTAHWRWMVICDSVLLLNLWITEDLWFLFWVQRNVPTWQLLQSSRVMFQSCRTFPLRAFSLSVNHLAFFFSLVMYVFLNCVLEDKGHTDRPFTSFFPYKGTSHKLNISVFSHTSIKVSYIIMYN